jgi:NADH:ubiquinone oxidoreductase subunit F (NADH-binding)/(2Fe-2S) ferredoxin
MKIKSADDLKKAQAKAAKSLLPSEMRVTVGASTCGNSQGASQVMELLKEGLKKGKAKATIVPVGCNGLCHKEPVVEVIQKGKPRVVYGPILSEDVPGFVTAITKGGVFKEKALHRIDSETRLIDDQAVRYASEKVSGEMASLPVDEGLSFFKKQLKISMRNCGTVDPESIEEYIGRGGYGSLAKALKAGKPASVIDEATKSGLRGRGGAGFPAGLKWKACRDAKGQPKYVVCNASEGDPDIGMHKSLLEGDPHSVLEGMIIGAYAVGASEGHVYVSDGYDHAAHVMEKAVRDAQEWGLLGNNILGSGMSFRVTVKQGGGAYICGEETALLGSLEGDFGEPRQRPPFPAESGLMDKPTVVNSVETWSAIPVIVAKGGAWFAKIGTKQSTGTKVISISGSVNTPCLVEVPMGTKVKEVIDVMGGGLPGGKKLKAVCTGGPSGGILPAKSVNTPITYEDLTKAGTLLGAGGFVVIDDGVDMVEFARYLTRFFEQESCGKCTTCREGSKRLREILDDLCEGRGRAGDIQLLQNMSQPIHDGSFCALGKTLANPILSTIRHFKGEYEKRIPKGA